MDFLTLASRRYSCKKYDPTRRVDEVSLQTILECGRVAPTAKNLQEQHIYVVTSDEYLARIDQCTPCRYGAPMVLVVTYDKNNVYTYPGGQRQSGAEDATIVATHMMLGAADCGVDSCWVNCFDPDRMHEALSLPDNEDIVMLLDLGYAHPEVGPLPNHGSRKPLSETVSEL
ncbi:MAG: nitroreductase family protein [Bacteroides sp.]|nr:nitroreductase family protein [Bacteroides sp.]